MTAPNTIRLFGTAPDSIVDGPGLRFAVFVQGCTHGCPGCHNPVTWDVRGGLPFDEAAKEELDTVKQILAEEMHGAANLKVCLEIDMHTGENWYEAK